MIRAVLQIDGPRPLLRALREHLSATLTTGGAAVRTGQIVQSGSLTVHLDAPDGLPYPELVAASALFADCVFTLTWHSPADSGVTTFRNGEIALARQDGHPIPGLRHALEIDARETLVLGLALVPEGADDARHVGYAATRFAETYFHVDDGAAPRRILTTAGDGRHWDEEWTVDATGHWSCEAVSQLLPIATSDLDLLERLADGYRSRWLWFDHAAEEEIAIERTRAQAQSRPVFAINVQSRALARMGGARSFSEAGAGADSLFALLRGTWGAIVSPSLQDQSGDTE